MVSLPWKCKYCERLIYHYAACFCNNAQLDDIDVERKVLKYKLQQLDAREKALTAARLRELGVIQ